MVNNNKVFSISILIEPSTHAIRNMIRDWHVWLAYLMIIIAFGHAVIALVHYYIIKNFYKLYIFMTE